MNKLLINCVDKIWIVNYFYIYVDELYVVIVYGLDEIIIWGFFLFYIIVIISNNVIN